MSEKSKIDLQMIGARKSLTGLLVSRPEILGKMARVKKIKFDGNSEGAGANTVLKDGTEVFIPLEGVIDLDEEIARVKTEIARLEDLMDGARKKLSNEKFLSGAPTEIVEKERLKEESFQQQLSTLKSKLGSLSDI